MDKLEETLNGKFQEVFNEVVTADVYRLQQLKFKPRMVFDIGANVGVFARHARTCFPNALIVSVEPDLENWTHFRKFTPDPRTFLIRAALGHGQIYHNTQAPSGAHETYLSAGLGYPQAEMKDRVEKAQGLETSGVRALRLSDIIHNYWKPGTRSVLKVDCEGAENTIWDHPDSMDVLRQMDYIAMEIHFFALTQEQNPIVREATLEALRSLEQTHKCERSEFMFWATKKELC